MALVRDRSEAAMGDWSFERGWRLVATAISFGLFGFGGLIMALLYFPAVNLFVRNPVARASLAQASVHRIWRLYIEIMRALGVLTFEGKGLETLKDLRGCVVVANHPSLLDVVFLMAFMRRTRAVVKAGVWRNPFMTGVVTAANYIPNLGDPQRLVDDCAQALREGANLCIFPEGSRTPPGVRRQYQRGFANAALAAGAPVQIVTIKVEPPTLLKGEPWHHIPLKRPHWTIEVHERIDVKATFGYESRSIAARKLADMVAEKIEGLLRE
jgi:1-acyl-sn-glycerol-3-phosphate acyltransferase